MLFQRSAVVAAFLSSASLTQAWNVEWPPCSTHYTPYTYAGCYQDAAPGQPPALVFRSPQDAGSMTVELCAAECKGNGFRYAGLAYYGQCFCGNVIDGAKIDDGKCNFPCNGDKSEMCGSDSILSVWQDPMFPSAPVGVADYKPAGCYSDNSSSGRALSWSPSVDEASFTAETCLAACGKLGFPLGGVEYGHECWCGNGLAPDSVKLDDTKCATPCEGDGKETCGGPGAMKLYVAEGLQSTEPCGDRPPYPPPPATTSTTEAPPPSSSTAVYTPPPPPYTSTPEAPTTTANPPPPPSTSTAVYPPPPPSSSTPEAPTTTSYPPPPPATETSTSPANPPPPPSTSTAVYPPPPPTTTSYPPPPPTTETSTPVYPPPPPPATTSTPVPPPTTTKATPTTSAPPQCTSVVTVPPTCEYKCGNWCLPGIPDFGNEGDCLKAFASALASVSSCFKYAGFPGALECFQYALWAQNIQKYCIGGCRNGKCSKGDCWGQFPPSGGSPSHTTTTVVPCPPAATTTTTKPSHTKPPPATTTTSTPSTCPPTPTNICTQPSNPKYGYGPGNPVGGIPLPLVSCNDERDDWARNPFKLYNSQNRRECPSYPRSRCGSACEDACKEQYEQCVAVYQKGCQDLSNGRYNKKRAASLSLANQFTVSWGTGSNSPSNAAAKCKAQYADCLAVNRGVRGDGRCTTFGW